jgi:hypothetical protein
VIEEAVLLNSFERLSSGRAPGQIDNTSHYRRGVPGEWRSLLDPTDVEAARASIGDIVAALGYDFAETYQKRWRNLCAYGDTGAEPAEAHDRRFAGLSG